MLLGFGKSSLAKKLCAIWVISVLAWLSLRGSRPSMAYTWLIREREVRAWWACGFLCGGLTRIWHDKNCGGGVKLHAGNFVFEGWLWMVRAVART